MNVTTVHEFPKGTWLENIDQRPSGLLLLTTLTAPHILQLDASNPDHAPEIIATFPEKKCTLGIVEIEPDIFAIVAGGFDMSTGTLNDGSSSIYQLDMTTTPATTGKIADVPSGKLLNGLTFLPPSPAYPKGLLLAADSMVGGIWSVDPVTRRVEMWSEDVLMAPQPAGGIGINGVQYDDRTSLLYFSNTRVEGGFLASVAVDPGTYRSVGEGVIVGGKAQGVGIDDFDLDLDGQRAFVAAHVQNQFDAVDLKTGQVTVLAGAVKSTEIAVPTAVKIGRTDADKERGIAYICTTGGFPGGVDGVVIGGQVLAVSVKEDLGI